VGDYTTKQLTCEILKKYDNYIPMKILSDLKTLYGKKKPAATTPSPRHLGRILIVEDEEELAKVLAVSLKEEGFEVSIASNGKIGLEMVASQKPQLVLLDLLMPVMDGKIMLRRMREMPQFKRLPVIVLTNAGEVENIRETQRYSNADEFLIKSNVSTDEIIEKAKEVLGILSWNI